MLTLLLAFFIIIMSGKLIGLIFKAGWTMFKITVCFMFLPALTIVLLSTGLVYIAVSVILLAGIIGLVMC